MRWKVQQITVDGAPIGPTEYNTMVEAAEEGVRQGMQSIEDDPRDQYLHAVDVIGAREDDRRAVWRFRDHDPRKQGQGKA